MGIEEKRFDDDEEEVNAYLDDLNKSKKDFAKTVAWEDKSYEEKYGMTKEEEDKLLKNETLEIKENFKELTPSQRATAKMLMEDYANSAMHAIAFAKQADPDGDGIRKK